MTFKKAAADGALFLIVLFCTFRVYRVYSFVNENPVVKPNVLIVSVCSFRAKLLSLYGAVNKGAAPNLEKFFDESSFVFENAYNGMGWTNIVNFTTANTTVDTFFYNLYEPLGHLRGAHLWRVPLRRSVRRLGYIVNDNDFEKDISATIKTVEEYVRFKRAKPFFTAVHFKYLHYPLIDRFNPEARWDQYLDPAEKALVVDYLQHPEKHYHKLSFLLLLANNPYHILAHPRFKGQDLARDPASLRKIMGLMTNSGLLAEWKASPGYEGDLQILEKIYRANVNYLDKVLEPFLNLWGDKELQDNTVVIFAADHGEAHMERDELTHGLSLWDTSLHVPVAIRFPGAVRRQVLTKQIDHVALSLAIQDLVNGARTPATFLSALEKRWPDVIIARNCMNDIRGLRYKNKYKYFVRLADDERFLFDLEKDPLELKNLAYDLPQEVARMETLYWQNLHSIVNVDTNACPVSLPN